MREKQTNGSDIDSAMSVILMSPFFFFSFVYITTNIFCILMSGMKFKTN